MTSESVPKIALIAGEPSGDQLGGALMRALRNQRPDIQFIGIGGPAMATQGLVSLFPMQELSIIGIWGILKDLPNLWVRVRQTVTYLKTEKPDVLVTIDAPEFSLRVAKRLSGTKIKRIHYTPPTVWAWRPRRAEKLAKFLDHLLAIYPFEPPYFTPHHLTTTFVGHTVVEKGIQAIDQNAFRTVYPLGDEKILTLMPGSRKSEVAALLPRFKEVVETLHAQDPDLKFFLPTVDAVEKNVRLAIESWSAPVQLIKSEQEKYQLMRASTAVLAASGTVNLELAMANVPFVITYIVSPITAWLARKLIRLNYVTMVNIIENDEVVPELLQERCNAQDLCQAIRPLLYDEKARQEMKEKLQTVTAKLLPQHDKMPSTKAAEIVLSFISR